MEGIKLMPVKELTCFKAYDIRGELGINFDPDIAYRIGRAVAQHFLARKIIVGRDVRATSPKLATAVARGITDAGADVLNLGLCGTEEMYWAVTQFSASAGIVVTASHNPINYNGIKMVKSDSRPLDDLSDFKKIKALAEHEKWVPSTSEGHIEDISVIGREKYVEQCLSFIDVASIKPLRIVVNCGNGAAGPTFDAIAEALVAGRAPLDFVRVHHEPDKTFPNGIPNPLLVENHSATGDVVAKEGADFGIAFDGDFDRCFFFNAEGQFVPGEYIVGLLAANFIDKEQGAKIVHDPRAIWNTQDIVATHGGIAIQSKTGHAFIKDTMRKNEAVYGGEMSAHHYFKDFAYCDSGMIPWLLVAELISKHQKRLTDLVADRFDKFPSSGEMNFQVEDADAVIKAAVSKFEGKGKLDSTDGVSFSFSNWRFNLRKSNTEPLVRLNVESRGDAEVLARKVELLKSWIC